tara:strand:+ start:252 stop:458 length:207 start_codon:yes stop_codon:yes gene_type:complete
MINIYMKLYDFFNSIADYFWRKHIDLIKKRAKQDHGTTRQKKEKQQEKSNTNKQGSVRKSKGRNKKKV